MGSAGSQWVAIFFIGFFIWLLFRIVKAGNRMERAKRRARSTRKAISKSRKAVAAPSSVPTKMSSSLPKTIEPAKGIVLKLKHSKKKDARGKVIYCLDARADASKHIKHIIKEHELGKRVLYESDAVERHRDKVAERLLATQQSAVIKGSSQEHFIGAGKMLWHLGGAAIAGIRAALGLKITVDSLFKGIHVECRTVPELREVEEAVRGAKGRLCRAPHFVEQRLSDAPQTVKGTSPRS